MEVKNDAASQALFNYMKEMDTFLCKILGIVCGFEMDFGGKLKAESYLSVAWPDNVRVKAAMAGIIAEVGPVEAAAVMISSYAELYRLENGGLFKPKNTKVMISLYKSAEKAVTHQIEKSKAKGTFMDFNAPFINLYNNTPSGAKAWQNAASRF